MNNAQALVIAAVIGLVLLYIVIKSIGLIVGHPFITVAIVVGLIVVVGVTLNAQKKVGSKD
jgi:hypothetical protein